jgi:hypothetical protein
MLAGLYDDRIRAVAAVGGMAEYASVLESPFVHVPVDALIPGVLETADLPDIAGSLAPRPLLISECRDGRNVALGAERVEKALGRARQAYTAAGRTGNLTLAGATAEWLLTALGN